MLIVLRVTLAQLITDAQAAQLAAAYPVPLIRNAYLVFAIKALERVIVFHQANAHRVPVAVPR